MVTTMVAGSLLQFSLGALAPVLLEELSISRSRLGLLQSLLFLIAASCSPLAGRLVDRFGTRATFVATLGAGALAMAAIAAAQGYVWCLAASVFGGLAAAGGNPATNKLIATQVPESRQGALIGIKQSGVQVSAIIVGVVLPFVAVRASWRVAVLIVMSLPLAVALVAAKVLRPARPEPASRRAGRSTAMPVLVAYAFLMGSAVASFSIYIPLYGFEELGLSLSVAGSAVALIGVIGVAGRMAAPRMLDRDDDFGAPLAGFGIAGCLAVLLLILAPYVGTPLFWGGVVVAGGVTAWNSVLMLAALRLVTRSGVGATAGRVQSGFFFGVMTTPPLFGWIVDHTGAYDAVWLLVIGLFLAGGAIAFLARRSFRRRPTAVSTTHRREDG